MGVLLLGGLAFESADERFDERFVLGRESVGDRTQDAVTAVAGVNELLDGDAGHQRSGRQALECLVIGGLSGILCAGP